MYIRSVGIAVRSQKIIHDRRRFERVDLGTLIATHYEQRKQANIGPDVDYGISVIETDAML